jgi:hypothetical protein
MYSLTSIPTLCYDLVRSPTGPDWGDVLERALRLRPEDLAALQELAWQADPDEVRGSAARSRAWDEIGAVTLTARRMSTVLPEVRGALAAAELEPVGLDRVLTTLTGTPLGGLSDLLAMLRGDVFDWTWARPDGADSAQTVAVQRWPAAVAVVSDALAAAYLGPSLPEPSRVALGGRWVSWLRESAPLDPSFAPVLPGDDVLDRNGPALRSLLERASRLDRQDLLVLQQACDAARGTGFSWPTDMHVAARTAVLTDRVRVTAIAQLAATRALLQSAALQSRSGYVAAGDISEAAAETALVLSGALPAMTAAVAAMAVGADVDIEVYARLLAPWRVAVG